MTPPARDARGPSSSMTCEVDTVTKAQEHFYHVLATALSPYAPPGEGWRMTREPERAEGQR